MHFKVLLLSTLAAIEVVAQKNNLTPAPTEEQRSVARKLQIQEKAAREASVRALESVRNAHFEQVDDSKLT